MARIVIMTGGGIKGAVAAARSSAADDELLLVHADYGQPSAAAELNATRELAETFHQCRVISLTLPHVGQLHEGTKASPESSAPDSGPDRREAEVLSPASLRGLMPVLMSHAIQAGLRVGASTVVTGLTRLCDATHLGLPPGYPSVADTDGWYEFVHSFNLMLASLSPQRARPKIEAPLIDMSYPQIIQLAARFEVPLKMTWTCEQGRPKPCGRCEPCKSRARAFLEVAMVDPLTSPLPSSTSAHDIAVTS